MGLTAKQRAALHGLTEDGVLSADQEDAVRQALDGSAPGTTTGQRVVELLGYVGGGLLLGGAALLVGTSWEELSRAGRLVLLGSVTAALVVAGVLIAGGPTAVRGAEHQRRRVVATLFALAAVTAAFTGGVAVDRHEVIVGATAGLLVAVAGYAALPSAIGLLAMVGTSAVAVGAWTSETAAQEVVGAALFALGVGWMGLAIVGVVGPRPFGLALGAAVALAGAQQPLIGSDSEVLAYGLTAALGLGCFAVYLRVQDVVLLVTGVVATTIVVPEAVSDWTDGAVGGGALLLVAGVVLLAASGVSMRLRRIR